jgi:hypothetical protein
LIGLKGERGLALIELLATTAEGGCAPRSALIHRHCSPDRGIHHRARIGAALRDLKYPNVTSDKPKGQSDIASIVAAAGALQVHDSARALAHDHYGGQRPMLGSRDADRNRLR